MSRRLGRPASALELPGVVLALLALPILVALVTGNLTARQRAQGIALQLRELKLTLDGAHSHSINPRRTQRKAGSPELA